MTKESKDDILSALPKELLEGEKVSQADLIKFAPVLAHQQALAYEKKAINETQAQHDAAAAARSKEGSIWEFMKRNPVAMVGALGAGYCLAKGLAEFGGNTNFASYKRQHKWMKGRLFSQAFCLVACVGGHQYHIYQYEKREAEKKELYTAERDYICQQTGISHDEFEKMRHNEALERQMGATVETEEARRIRDGDFFTAEQRAEIAAALKAAKE